MDFLQPLLLMALISSASAYDFYVGGRDGWTQSPSEGYNHWAERMRFQIHDKLVFKYKKGEDSVVVVTKEDYDSCNTKNPIKKLDDGDSVFELDRSGPFYFVSGSDGKCAKGQKLIVVVLADRSKKPITPTPPTISPSPSAVPPTISPSPPPSTVPPTISPSPSTVPPSISPSPSTVPPTISPSPSPLTASPTISPSPSPSTASPTISPSPSPSTVPPTTSPSPSPSTVSPTISPSPSPLTVSPTTPSPSTMPPTTSPPSTNSPTGNSSPPSSSSPDTDASSPATSPAGNNKSSATIETCSTMLLSVLIVFFATAIFE